MTPQQVAADFIMKYKGDSAKALQEFNTQSQMKLSTGSVPNEKFTQVSDILGQVSMIQDEVDRLGEVTKIKKSPAINTLIFNRVSGMNELLGDEVYDLGIGEENLTKNVFDYEQALIKLENEIPRIKKPETRMNTLWTINELMKSIDSLKGMSNVQA